MRPASAPERWVMTGLDAVSRASYLTEENLFLSQFGPTASPAGQSTTGKAVSVRLRYHERRPCSNTAPPRAGPARLRAPGARPRKPERAARPPATPAPGHGDPAAGHNGRTPWPQAWR